MGDYQQVTGDKSFLIMGDPAHCDLPLIGHVPHAGTLIPEHIRRRLTLDGEELRIELLAVTDLLADELYLPVLEAGGIMFVNRMSRLVTDPERFRDDEEEPAAARGAGAVFSLTSSGLPLRDPPFTPEERDRILTSYYDPYADGLTHAVSDMMERFGHASIVDCHTFPARPVAWAEDQDDERPQVCIGTDPFHTPAELAEQLLATATSLGYHAMIDKPYNGSYVPSLFFRKERRVSSVLIEIRRDLYVDAATGERTDGFDRSQELVRSLVSVLAGAALR